MRYKILSVAAALMVGSACGDITSINTNPNGPVDVPPPSILGQAIQGVVGNVFGPSFTSLDIRGGGLWVQYYSEIQYRDEDKYILRSGISGGWDMYPGPVEDFQRIIDKGVESSTPNWEAVGRIMKAYTFSVMTDAMGDLPYTDALKGGEALTPTYDTQQSIYNAMFSDLATASGEIDPSAIGFPTGDLLYGGSMSEWRLFANSLRLRLAMHLTNVDAAKAQSEAAAAVAAGVFGSNDDNAQLTYLAAPPNQNPIYTNALTRDDYGMSQTYVDSLLSWNDPRLPVFADTNRYGQYRGLSNGLNDGEGPSLDSISRYGSYWRKTPNASLSLLTYSEVLFLEAEAAQRGWITGDPATLYNAAITASMEQYGVAAGDIATYLADPRVVYNAGTGLSQIAYQKWVSMFMQGAEAWTEWRRTQVPTLVPGPRAVLAGIPERLPYQDNEAVLNKTNLDAAVAAQHFSAGNDITGVLWYTGRQ
jgi:hypothetical protein